MLEICKISSDEYRIIKVTIDLVIQTRAIVADN